MVLNALTISTVTSCNSFNNSTVKPQERLNHTEAVLKIFSEISTVFDDVLTVENLSRSFRSVLNAGLISTIKQRSIRVGNFSNRCFNSRGY